MNSKLNHLISTSLIATFLSACGGSGGGSNFIGVGGGTDRTGIVSIGISDAPVDDAEEVILEIDKITFKKSGNDDVVVDRFTFTSRTLNIVDEDSFQIDLLDYQSGNQAIIINDLELPAGRYTNIVLTILDEDVNRSYVQESVGGQRKAINVIPDELQLGSFTVDADGDQLFTIDVNLRQALTYRTGTTDTYILKPRGIRVQDNADDRSISGSVDPSLFNTDAPCSNKANPNIGNVVYLYEGHDLGTNNLADVFDPAESDNAVPANAIEPFAAAAVVANGLGQWVYSFSFLPAGDYTLAFSCDAADDDPEDYNGSTITVPFPDSQVIELTTGTSSAVCNLPIDNDVCS